MRKIKLYTLLTLIIALVSTTFFPSFSYAQHIKFKGIEICDKKNNFEQIMKQKNIVKDEKNNFFNLDFAGYKAHLNPLYTPITNQAYSVNIKILSPKDWKTNKNNYLIFKSNLSNKYNKPVEEKEKFFYPYIEGDDFEYKAGEKNSYIYTSTWETEYGKIILSILYNNGFYLNINYIDKQGNELNEKETNNQIYKDL